MDDSLVNEPDPIVRARRAAEEIQQVRRVRAEAIQEAVASGMTQGEVAQELGVTKQAIQKLLRQLREG